MHLLLLEKTKSFRLVRPHDKSKKIELKNT